MHPLNLIFVGTAGAGKSSIVATFGRWIEQNTDQRVVCINLDPGCETIPFAPSFDIRDYFTVAQLMREENLGPNGAMIRASELLEQSIGELSKKISEIKADIRLIDTPGQMEIFLFHGGPEMVKLVDGTTISLFLIDAGFAARAVGFVLAKLLGLSVRLRLGVPTISILNKMDLFREHLADIDRMQADAEFLRDRVLSECPGVMADLMLKLSENLPIFLPAARLVKTSAKTGEGMDKLYDIIHEVFCACGDLT